MLPHKIDYLGRLTEISPNLQSLMFYTTTLAWNARRLHGLMDASGVSSLFE
jgi:hypothetical protein